MSKTIVYKGVAIIVTMLENIWRIEFSDRDDFIEYSRDWFDSFDGAFSCAINEWVEGNITGLNYGHYIWSSL